jgi:hypothetical protein
MKLSIITLRTITTDEATGMKGMLTHLQVGQDHRQFYRFQPRALNPEDGQPVKGMWLVPERFAGTPARSEVELPLEVLGTHVRDTGTGFQGTAVAVNLHSSGCVHVEIQPKGQLGKTGAAIDSCDFDIRRLEGRSIKVMTDEQREADQRARPSPAPMERSGPRAPV